MESPLKERLTGALIVIAVLVIAVPEMLSGPDKSSASAGSGADAGPPVRTYSLELGSNAVAPTQNQSALTPQSSEPATPAPAATPAPITKPAPVSASAPAESAESPVATVTVPAGKPRVAPPDVKPAAPATTSAPVAASPAAASPAAASPVTTSTGQWWAQLGSFSARDNAERLARDLRAKGYTISVARLKVGNKDLYRVRAGPVAGRDAAAALQSRLAAAGHKSSLVPP